MLEPQLGRYGIPRVAARCRRLMMEVLRYNGPSRIRPSSYCEQAAAEWMIIWRLRYFRAASKSTAAGFVPVQRICFACCAPVDADFQLVGMHSSIHSKSDH